MSEWSIAFVIVFIMFSIGFALWLKISDEDNSFWMTILYELAIYAVLAITLWKCAERDILYGFFTKNQAAIVEAGDKPVKMIGTPPNGYIIDGLKVRKAEAGEIQKYGILARWYKMFFIGLPWRKIKRFILIHERLKKDIPQNTPATEWMDRDSVDAHPPERCLLMIALHDFVVPGVQLEEGYVANVVFQAEFALRDAEVAVYERAGSQPNSQGVYTVDFYGAIENTISTAVENALRGIGYEPETDSTNNICREGWLATDKSSVGQICKDIVIEINRTAVKLSGYEIMQGSFTKWSLASDEQREQIRLEGLAKIKKNIALLTADSENAETISLMKALKEQFPDASDSELAERVESIMNTRKISQMQNLTVYAPGSNLAIGTSSTGGNKKGKK